MIISLINDLYKLKLIDSKYYKILKENNIYSNKILYIWNKHSLNDKIYLKIEDCNFIENGFSGNFKEFLIFIIPRICKLNIKHLNLLITDDNIFISENKDLNSIVSTESDCNDKDYVKLLELNINSLQNQLQNLNDKILPSILKLELSIKEINNKIIDNENLTKNSIKILEDRLTNIINIINI